MGGAGGVNFLAGLTNGFAKGQELQIQKEYQKALVDKTKAEGVESQIHANIATKMSQGKPLDPWEEAIFYKNRSPIEMMMVSRMTRGGMTTNGMATPEQTVGEISGSTTFPGELTGIKNQVQAPLGGTPLDNILGSPDQMLTTWAQKQGYVPTIISRQPYEKVNRQTGAVHNYILDSAGNEIDKGSVAPKARVVEGSQNNLPVKMQVDNFGRPIAGAPVIPQSIAGVKIDSTLPGGSTEANFINPYNASPITQQAQQGAINFTLDMNDPNAIKQARQTLDIIEKKGPSGALRPTGAIQTSPGEKDLPIPEKSRTNYIDSNLNIPEPGTTPNQVQGKFTLVDDSIRDKIMAKKDVVKQFMNIKPLMEAVYGPENDAKENSAWYLRGGDYWSVFTGKIKSNPSVALLDSFYAGTLPQSLKAKGQVGSLSDRDMEMGKKTQPVFDIANPDTPELAWQKWRSTVDYFDSGAKTLLQEKNAKPPSSAPQVGGKTPQGKKPTVDWQKYYGK